MRCRLKKLHVDTPESFYAAWPDVTSVDDRWRPLVKPLYSMLVQQPVCYTPAKGGHWVPLAEAVLQYFGSELVARLGVGNEDEVLRTVVKVYSLTGQNLVKLPDHVLRTLRHHALLGDVNVINPLHVLDLLPACLDRLEDADKLSLLHYLCCHDDALRLLRNQPLLPLQNGSFGAFQDRERRSPVTYFCREELVLLFPGVESQFCRVGVCPALRQHLYRLAVSGMSGMEFWAGEAVGESHAVPRLSSMVV